jgi:hypothetical protein
VYVFLRGTVDAIYTKDIPCSYGPKESDHGLDCSDPYRDLRRAGDQRLPAGRVLIRTHPAKIARRPASRRVMLIKSRAGDEGQRRDGGCPDGSAALRYPGMPKAAELVKSGKVDVFVPTRQTSSQYQISCPALEFLTADFPLTGREAGTAYVRKLIENVKAEGLIRSAVEKAGVRGAVEE